MTRVASTTANGRRWCVRLNKRGCTSDTSDRRRLGEYDVQAEGGDCGCWRTCGRGEMQIEEGCRWLVEMWKTTKVILKGFEVLCIVIIVIVMI